MPHVSLTAEREASEKFSVEIDGKVFVARSVSRRAVIQWLMATEQAGDDPLAQERALHTLLRVAFPPKWAYALPRRIDPVITIMNLGPQERERVLAPFFAFALMPILKATGRTPTAGTSIPSPFSVDGRPSSAAS